MAKVRVSKWLYMREKLSLALEPREEEIGNSNSVSVQRHVHLGWKLGVTRSEIFLQSSSVQFHSVQSLSCVQLFVTPRTVARQASLSITNSRSSPKLMPIELVMPSNHLTLCRSLLFPPSIFPTITVFSNESVLHTRWPKYWSFSFNISPSNEHPGLISFRMDWLNLLEVPGTLKSLLQHHSSKASILWCSAFFRVQLSHPYMATGKTIALTRWTFVDKVISLLYFPSKEQASFNFTAAVTILMILIFKLDCHLKKNLSPDS